MLPVLNNICETAIRLPSNNGNNVAMIYEYAFTPNVVICIL